MNEETQTVETVEAQGVPAEPTNEPQPQDEKKYTDADVDAIIDKNYLQDYVELLKNKNARTPEELTKTLGIRYIEAQFHGDVGLTDISSMYFTNKIPNNNQINALKSYGIDVFVKEGEKFVRVE